VGAGSWPPLALEVLGPEGGRVRLETEARPFEVVSVLPRFADRVEPFPPRWPSEPRAGSAPLAAAAAGAAAALAAVALAVALRRGRRRRAARRDARAAAAAAAEPWRDALAALDAAARDVDTDWRRSADRGALELKRFVARRWNWPIECRTTEEAAGLAPPFALAARWPAALACLGALDELRFRPLAPAQAAARVRAELAAARRLGAEATPPQAAS
jgi:hypothetical protein